MQAQRVGSHLITQMIALNLLILAAGCSQTEPPIATVSPQPSTPVATSPPSPVPTPASPLPESDPLADALDTAIGAAAIAQSAVSPDDWKLVANQWQQAITTLNSIPATNPQKALAEKKIAEYQRNLTYAKQQIANSIKAPASTLVTSQPITPTAAPSQSTTPQPETLPAAPSQPLTSEAPPTETSANVALASHLKGIGAKMYATFWCGVCRRQEQEFGEEALKLINIIECDPRGKNAQPELCRQAKIRAYPTWEIKGQIYQGGMSLDELADLSGYQGSRNFTN